MPRRSRLPLSVVALAALAAGCDGGPVEPRGVSWTLAEHRAATLSDIGYLIELRIPEARTDSVVGESTIGFFWSDAEGRPVTIDFLDPAARVRSVEVNGVPVEDWSPQNDHIVIPAGHFRPEARNELRIMYRAGDEALNRSDDFLYTLFVPDRAHFTIPVFDQPNLKARVAWRVLLPEGWVAVANGPMTAGPGFPAALAGEGIPPSEVVPEGEETLTDWNFAPSEPIPTYLFALAAGRFTVERAEVDGRTFTMYHRETDRETVARNRDEIFRLHAAALDWLEDYTGIGYPFAKFDFVLIPPFQYGGMEHPGAVTYRQSSLMLDESATQGARLGRAGLIAHETAHMWFGDLVTMNWFDDVWTKEVFANFMAAKIVEPSFPEVDHELRFLTSHHPSAYGVDRTPGANPIRQPLDNLREAGTLYGAIIYQKAPIVMKQLERTVGEETFRDGLREYLANHAYGNATWPDLIRILDARHPSDLSAWSEVWVEEPGRPRIDLSWEPNTEGTGRVVLTQSDDWGRERSWPQVMELAGFFDGEPRFATVSLDAPRVVVDAWVDGQRPDFVIPNASGIEYGLFVPDSAWIRATLSAMPSIDSDLLRGAAWIDLGEWVREGLVDPETALRLALATVLEEENELILGRILGTLSELYWSWIPEEARDRVAVRLEETLWQGVQEAEDVSRRASFFSAFRGIATTDAATRQLARIWSGEQTVEGLPLSENDRIELAEALAIRGVDDAEAILDRMATEIENPDRAERFAWVRPSLSSDPVVRETFFISLADEENRAREPWVLDGLSNLNHPLRREHARRFVGPALALVEEIQATGDIFFPQRWLGASLGPHNHPEVVAEIEAFLEERPDYPPRLRGKILQAYDDVRRAARAVYGPEAASEWRPWS